MLSNHIKRRIFRKQSLSSKHSFFFKLMQTSTSTPNMDEGASGSTPVNLTVSPTTQPIDIAERYKELALHPANRLAMLQDVSTLSACILFLDNNSDNVVITTLEVLKLLSEHPVNKNKMRNEEKLMVSLKTLVRRSDVDSLTRKLTKELLENLECSAKRASFRRRSYGYGSGSFISQNSNARTMTLHISNLADSSREEISKLLLSLKGIISFTFSISQKRCKIRYMELLSAKIICTTIIRKLDLQVQHVVKNDEGEIFLSYENEVKSENSIETDIHGYLPEDNINHIISPTTIDLLGSADSQPTLFNRLSTFISNTLYW